MTPKRVVQVALVSAGLGALSAAVLLRQRGSVTPSEHPSQTISRLSAPGADLPVPPSAPAIDGTEPSGTQAVTPAQHVARYPEKECYEILVVLGKRRAYDLSERVGFALSKTDFARRLGKVQHAARITDVQMACLVRIGVDSIRKRYPPSDTFAHNAADRGDTWLVESGWTFPLETSGNGGRPTRQ